MMRAGYKMRESTKRFCIELSGVLVITGICFAAWWLFYSPRYYFLNEVMECMIQVGSDSREAYDFCREVVIESKAG